ncbi:hypothetical protein [Alishewanella longhuensis]
MNLSKQKVLSILLDKGISIVRDEMQAGKSYLVNKNFFYLFFSSHTENLDDDNWEELAGNIAIGSTLFFYSEERGITAYGNWSGSMSKKLSDFNKLEHPISILDLKNYLGISIAPSEEKIIPFPQGSRIVKLPHICPKCDIRANTYEDMKQLFGFRNTTNGVRPQSWCRGCRSKT